MQIPSIIFLRIKKVENGSPDVTWYLSGFEEAVNKHTLSVVFIIERKKDHDGRRHQH